VHLLSKTKPEWIKVVLSDFDRFLVDHALCERKASALAMSLVAHYPNKQLLVKSMLELAIEELEHFQQVHAIICERGLTIVADAKDEYVNHLHALMRKCSPDEYFLDRLLVAAIIEWRGCERFEILAKALTDEKLKGFYLEFWRSEARHHGLFLRLAREYFPGDVVDARYAYMLTQEAQIVEALPVRAAMH
jgi:tRNA-(ms[2]io[6]A)-hydroxylase